jgi:hypothetical protein
MFAFETQKQVVVLGTSGAEKRRELVVAARRSFRFGSSAVAGTMISGKSLLDWWSFDTTI